MNDGLFCAKRIESTDESIVLIVEAVEKSHRPLNVGLYATTAVLGVAMAIKLLGVVDAQLAVVVLDGQDVGLDGGWMAKEATEVAKFLTDGLRFVFLIAGLILRGFLVGRGGFAGCVGGYFGVARERPQ